MRIITGKARGKRLSTLSGENTRPTAERVKEALFSIIQFEITGTRFLDLFAGSGQMGLEALSRGAQSAVMVDSSSEAAAIIKKNIASSGLEGAVFLNTDAVSYITLTNDTYDIIFLDPPYAAELLEKTVSAAFNRLSPGGILICEYPDKNTVSVPEGATEKRYRYGITALSVIRKGADY